MSSQQSLAALDERQRLTMLDGGVRVVSDPDPSASAVSLSLWVPAGSRDEPAEHAGAFHFLEHLLFKGTRRRSARQVNQAIDEVGGELNAFTSKESTAFLARVPAGEWHRGLELLTELVWQPALSASDVESEREVILEELAMMQDTPDELVASLLDEQLFEGHALGREVLGSAATIGSLSHEVLTAVHRDFYLSGPLVVAVAGPCDHDELVERVAAVVPSTDIASAPLRVAPGPSVGADLMVDRPSEQVHVSYGWRGLPMGDPDRFALQALLHVLGDGPSSRLYHEVRDQAGLVYSIGTSSGSFSDAGMVELGYGAALRNLEAIDAIIEQQLDLITSVPVTDQELATALGYLRGSMLLSLETTGRRMSRLASSVVAYGRVEPLVAADQGFAAVTADDVLRVAQRVFVGHRTKVAVGEFVPE